MLIFDFFYKLIRSHRNRHQFFLRENLQKSTRIFCLFQIERILDQITCSPKAFIYEHKQPQMSM